MIVFTPIFESKSKEQIPYPKSDGVLDAEVRLKREERIIVDNDICDAGDVIPDFQISVREIFE